MASAGLLSRLVDAPHTFLQPDLPLYTDAVTYVKHTLDPLAADVSAVQHLRQQETRKKRKRGQPIADDKVLRLKQVHSHGLGPQQIWEQARRVIDAAREEAERGLRDVLARPVEPHTLEDGESEVSEEGELGEEGVDYEVEGPDMNSEEEGLDSEDGGEEDDIDFTGEDDFDDYDVNGDVDRIDEDAEPAEEFVADKFGLNDGFFSIDDFNKQTEFLEQQDARGEDDGAASDEEDVDWDADPLGHEAATATDGVTDEDDSEIADNDDEKGLGFGDPDAPSEDEGEGDELNEGDMDNMGAMSNTNSVLYADFFAPPAQVKRKNKKGRPNPHNFSSEAPNGGTEEVAEDMERTMNAVHRDLYEDEDSAGEEDEDENDEAADEVDPADPRARRSAHERRKAALAEEIRKLEAASVAKREWTLSGEARAADRPMNSLLEEHLDFERAGKPVPVITAEVSESIEELIKRRILAHDFQDIIRRRPDDLATGKDGRRGRLNFELDDSKSKKGLAEEYEEELLRRTDPNFVDAQDAKTRKQEQDIAALWNKIRTDLDNLSSWHFRPKAPAPQIEIRVDAPAIGMEDARPSAGGEVAGASQLAPQEVYRAAGAAGEEVVGKSGLPAGREELSREERKRRRRREKERIRKAGGNEPVKTENKGKKERKEVLGDLKRGGVKVIGAKGDVRNVEGKEVAADSGGVSVGAGKYKL